MPTASPSGGKSRMHDRATNGIDMVTPSPARTAMGQPRARSRMTVMTPGVSAVTVRRRARVICVSPDRGFGGQRLGVVHGATRRVDERGNHLAAGLPGANR